LIIKGFDPEKLREFKGGVIRRGPLLHQALEEVVTLRLNYDEADLEMDTDAK